MSDIENLKRALMQSDSLEFSLLFGSQARGDSNGTSDWDIAISFKDNFDRWNNLGLREDIRHTVSTALGIDAAKVDIVDIYSAGLSINATIVDEAIPLTGEGSLSLARYYQRIWANLEDHYWNLEHAV